MLLSGWLAGLSSRLRWMERVRSVRSTGARRRKGVRFFAPVAADLLEERTVLSGTELVLASGRTPKASLPTAYNPASDLTVVASQVSVTITSNLIKIEDAPQTPGGAPNLNQDARVAIIGIDSAPSAATLPTALTAPNAGAAATIAALTNSGTDISGKVAIIGFRGTTLNIAAGQGVTTVTNSSGAVVAAILDTGSPRYLARSLQINLGVNDANRNPSGLSSSSFSTAGTGNKTVVLSNVFIDGGVEIATGNGEDSIGFEDVVVNGILPGTLPPTPFIDGVRGGLEISTGSEGTGRGDALYFAGELFVANDVRINTESGDDGVYFDGLTSLRGGTTTETQEVAGDLLIDLAAGNDTLVAEYLEVGGQTQVQGSSGNDTIVVGGGSIFTGFALLSGGSGNDIFSVEDTTPNGTTTGPTGEPTGMVISGNLGDDSAAILLPAIQKVRFSGGQGNDTAQVSDPSILISRAGFSEATENQGTVTVPSSVDANLASTRSFFTAILVPQSNDDTGTTPQGITLTVNAAQGLLVNDKPKSLIGEALAGTTLVGQRASLVQNTPRGTTTVNADGSYVFTPAPNDNTAIGGAPMVFRYVLDNGVRFANSTSLVTIDVTGPAVVNNPPAGADATLTTPEDSPLVFTAANFGFSDPLDTPANTLARVRIASLPAAGALTLNGNPVAVGDFVTAAQITGGQFRYTNPLNQNGNALTTFTFQVEDNGGTANGGVNLDPTANTLTINVTPVNDAPVISRNGTPVTGATTATAAEDDDLGFNGTTLITLSDVDVNEAQSPANINVGRLSVVVTVTDGTIESETALPIGVTVTSGMLGTTTITLQGTPTDLNTALATLAYTPTANFNGAATVTFAVSDLGNAPTPAQTANHTINVTVLSVNDAPRGADATLSTAEDTPLVFTAANFAVNDVDDSPANTLNRVRIASLPLTGSLTVNGNPVAVGDFVTLAQINAGQFRYTNPLNQNGSALASFTFQVEDDGGTANGGVNLDPTANLMGIDVTAVNDAPVISQNGTPVTGAAAASTLEDQALPLTGVNLITLSDVDVNEPQTPFNINAGQLSVAVTATNGTITIGTALPGGVSITAGSFGTTTVTLQGAPADLNSALAILSYTPTADFHGAATVTFAVSDLGNSPTPAQTANHTINVTVDPVNDAPTFGLDSPSIGFISPSLDQPVTQSAFATGISAGPANESGQVLTFNLSNDNNALFEVAPSIDVTTGDLTFTILGGAIGSATVTVTLMDDGGTANMGEDSLTRTFVIFIT